MTPTSRSRLSSFRWLVVLALPMLACAASCSSTPGAGVADLPDAAPDAPSVVDAAAPDVVAPGPTGCPRPLAAADRARKVVVSHPFTETPGEYASRFRVLDLDTAGALTDTGVTFQMGTAMDGPIVFTPDGEIGLVAQKDGSLGAFRFDAAGKPVVIHAAFQGDFYARSVVMGPDGSRAYVLDANTEANGGGVHEVGIGCDGTLEKRGKVVPGGQAHAMEYLHSRPTQAVLSGRKAFGSAADHDLHLLELGGEEPSLVASGASFGDADAIASWVAITPDDRYALVTDNGFAKGSRMAVVALPGMTPVAVIATPNPAAIVVSPFGNAALLLNSDGEDALRVVGYDPANAAKPFAIKGEVAYVNKKPELPIVASVVTRGALRGRVLVSENVAVRQLLFTAAGGVTDLTLTTFPPGLAQIVGVMGVQP